jgi:V/A-type H+-transporting ATPase subunit I
MKHVELRVLTQELPTVSLTLAELGLLSLDQRELMREGFEQVPGREFRELYLRNRSRLDKIVHQLGLSLSPGLDRRHPVDLDELSHMGTWLTALWEECAACEERIQALSDERHMVEQLAQTLENFAELNIDLSRLQQPSLFLDAHLGLVPRANLRHLSEAVALAGYLLIPFRPGESQTHVVILGPRDAREVTLRAALDAAGFQRLFIPPEFQDQPERIRQRLEQQRVDLEEALIHEREATAERARQEHDRLQTALDALVLAEPYVEIDGAARSSGFLSLIQGWVPARDLARLSRGLEQRLDFPFQLDVRDPHPEERSEVPSAMAASWLLRPFELLVRQYGIPRYGEIEPTSLMAVSFLLMFGMMFGDVGHGACIALAALALRSRAPRIWPMVFLAGLSSTAFGLLYGSLFGYEHLIHPLWISPLSDPVLMLRAAVAWGVVFLVMANLLSIHNQLLDGQRLAALLGGRGLANLTLYAGLLWGAYSWLTQGRLGGPAVVVASASLGIIAGYNWSQTQAPLGERVLTVIIETFETVMQHVSSTLSFLRLAAFGLNHVALAIAIFTLAGTMDTTGHWTTIVLGNLFVLVLEGAIVTIQVLRLEYYEGFSRYFSGDGKAFRPLRLATDRTV